MKKIVILFAALMLSNGAYAQEMWNAMLQDAKDLEKSQRRELRRIAARDDYKFSLAIQIGTDIGGAIPIPLRYVPSTFNPYPSLFPSLGAKVTVPLDRRWSLSGEVTYKTVSMDADAYVLNQRFQSENTILYFSGSATMNMRFDMVEVPLYVRYNFSDEKVNRAILGPYFAYMLRSKFETTAKKGYQGAEPDNVGAPITEPFVMSFNSSLDDFDAGIMAGYERRLMNRVDLSLRVMVGFKDIFQRDNRYFEYKMWHMRGALTLSYDLFRVKETK